MSNDDPSADRMTLGLRLGMTLHESPLRYKIRRLLLDFPSGAPDIESWLVDVANLRGARVITRKRTGDQQDLPPPPKEIFSDVELIVACLQPNCIDHPQLLRPAAQLVSRGSVDIGELVRVARRERAERILAEVARQALKIDPCHPDWKQVSELLANVRPLRDTVIHWTRLAEPIMEPGKPNAQGWSLVA